MPIRTEPYRSVPNRSPIRCKNRTDPPIRTEKTNILLYFSFFHGSVLPSHFLQWIGGRIGALFCGSVPCLQTPTTTPSRKDFARLMYSRETCSSTRAHVLWHGARATAYLTTTTSSLLCFSVEGSYTRRGYWRTCPALPGLSYHACAGTCRHLCLVGMLMQKHSGDLCKKLPQGRAPLARNKNSVATLSLSKIPKRYPD